MKKLLFAIVMLGSFSAMFADSGTWRDQVCIPNLSTEEVYEQLIAPYMQETDALIIPRYCDAHADSELVKEYRECLSAWYSGVSVHYFSGIPFIPYHMLKPVLVKQAVSIIEKMKAEWQLADFDIEREIQETEKMLKKARDQYRIPSILK